ncbi:MAG: ATPase, T2SS/T4P/T4SS family [candidate division WOR-3 bacterium]
MSTLHTNDAPSAVNRLVDIGIEPFLIASSLNLIQAQRLLRKVCKNCKKKIDFNNSDKIEILKRMGLSDEEIRNGDIYEAGDGCPECNSSGYRGRIAVTEVMPITMNLRKMILKGASTDDLRKAAQEEGMRTLRKDGLIKLSRGLTTIDEVLRVTVES